jgi:hypothetical protein
MGRNEFTRTITETTVKVFIVTMDAESKLVSAPCKPVKVTGKLTNEQAQKVIKDTYGKDNTYIVTTESKEITYALSLDDFLKYAHVVEPKEKTE